jgi:hypothetical protein
MIERDGRVPAPDLLKDVFGNEIDFSKETRVWLDDDLEDRTAPEGWLHLRSVREVAMVLLLGNVVQLSLDSDLDGDVLFGRGYEVIDFLDNQEGIAGLSLWPRDGIILHTANSNARDRMRKALETVSRRHPHLKVREDHDRPATQPLFLVERVEEGAE